MNKVLYAKEGAKIIMDRIFEDFPWQVRVEVDGVEIEVPEVCMMVVSDMKCSYYFVHEKILLLSFYLRCQQYLVVQRFSVLLSVTCIIV